MPKSFGDDGAWAAGGGFDAGSSDNSQPWDTTSFSSPGYGGWGGGAGPYDIGYGQSYAPDGSIAGLGAGKSTTSPTGSVVTNTGNMLMGYADGGVVEDTPTIPDDDAAQDDAQDANDAPSTQSAPAGGLPDVGNAPAYNALGAGQENPSAGTAPAQKIISYLMGAGAADPQTAQKFQQGVKHENPGISDDDANLLAVHKAGEMGGPAAAWAMVQSNRMQYNAKQAFAKAALNGIDGKSGNAQAAAQAATQAGAHILDGSATIFTAMSGGQGFTATVKMPGTDRSVNFQLNNDQMNQWLDVGKAGMWDKVMEEGGTPTALQKITASAPNNTAAAATAQPSQGQPTPPAAAGPDDQFNTSIKNANEDNQDSDPAEPEANPNAGQPSNIGKTPSSLNLSGEDTQRATLPPKPYSYGRDIEAQSRAAFPNISDEDKRQQFMAGQQDKRSTRINELGKAGMSAVAKQNVAGTQAGARTQGAQITGDSRVAVADKNADARVQSATVRSDKDIEVAKQKASVSLQQAQIKARDNDTRNKISQARLEINDPNAALRAGHQDMTPQQILKTYGLGAGEPAASPAPGGSSSPQAAPAQPPAPKQQATSSPPPIAQRVAGQTKVTTSKGSFTWTGQGWKAD